MNDPSLDEILRINLNVDVITNFVGFFGTYGLTDNWDVNVLVPLIHNQIKAKSRPPCLIPTVCPVHKVEIVAASM